VLVLGGALVLALPAGREALFGARARQASIDPDVPPADLARLFDRAFKKELAAAGVDTALLRTDTPRRGDEGAAHRFRWEVPLPKPVTVEAGRQAFEAALGPFRGESIPGAEGSDRRALLAGRLRADVLVEALVLGPEAPPSDRPRIALLVDDFGQELAPGSDALLEFGRGLTVAILPRGTRARDYADRCRARGLEVVVALPMEDLNYPQRDPGKDAILVDQSPREIRKRVAHAIDKLGGAAGLHTYMGELAIEDPGVVSAIFEEARDRRLYFLDSTKTTFSAALETGARMGIPVRRLKRDQVDIATSTAAQVTVKLEELAAQARRNGVAVGLLRPYPGSVEALRKLLPRWTAEGLEVVPLSEVVAVPETAPRAHR
jgi:polysaccharide deacetylase 2 family uncharacterized protein YibQ